jgi:non-canonical (house-cleaning) NTP pyrophosphatase
MGDDETRRGAINRASNARDESLARGEAADFFVGLEGGCVFEAPVEIPSSRLKQAESCTRPQELSCFAWAVVIKHGSSTVGAARTASFQLPDAVSQLVAQVCCTQFSFSLCVMLNCTGHGTRSC